MSSTEPILMAVRELVIATLHTDDVRERRKIIAEAVRVIDDEINRPLAEAHGADWGTANLLADLRKARQ